MEPPDKLNEVIAISLAEDDMQLVGEEPYQDISGSICSWCTIL